MNKKQITWLLLLMLSVALLLWRLARQDKSNTGSSHSPVGNEATFAATSNRVPNVLPDSQQNNAVLHSIEQIKNDLMWEWKRPIEFYGKVVDENERPVSDVTVSFDWSNAQGEGQHLRVNSDAGGLFLLENARGKVLQVRVQHPSYYTSRSNQISFEYADTTEAYYHAPNRARPVVFRLKQRGKAEPLLTGQKLFGFKPDGTKHFLDFKTQKNRLTPPGDVTVSFLRGERNSEGRYDWSATLSAPGGGIVEYVEELQFTAPADGYEESVVISQQAGAPDWTANLKKRFFFKTGQNGPFGRIEVTFVPKYNEMAALDLIFFLNPSGSRNLEFDSAVQPKQTQVE